MGDDWRQDILNDLDFMKAQVKAQEEAELGEKLRKYLLLPEDEGAQREFFAAVRPDMKKREVDHCVNLLRNKKIRDNFIRGLSEL